MRPPHKITLFCFRGLEISKTGIDFGRIQDRVERSDQLPIRGLALEVSGLGPRNHRRIEAIVGFPLRFRQLQQDREAGGDLRGCRFPIGKPIVPGQWRSKERRRP